MKLPLDWSAFFDSLCSHRVRFVVVGAHALAVQGRPRATQDLDVFVDPTEANARRLGAALADFGFPALARAWRRFARPDRMATLGVPPLQIDLLTSITGVSFRRAWASRVEVELDGRTVAFLGRDELRANKLAAGRPKDLADVAMLDESRPPPRQPRGRKPRSP